MPIYKQDNKLELRFNNIHNQIDYFGKVNFANPIHLISWAEPIGVVMMKAFSEINNIQTETLPTNSYIQSMMKEPINHKIKTYTPIVQIINRSNTEKIRNSLTSTIIQNFSHLNDFNKQDLKKYLNHIFSELMNNVSDHSKSLVGGYAMAQYYPTKKKVQFAIADKGCGFLKNIQTKFPEINNEYDAILKALERAVTASTNIVYGLTRNMGYGLYTLETILNETKGKMIIISNNTMLKLENCSKKYYKLDSDWGGTVVAVEFLEKNTNYEFETIRNRWLEENEEEEDFFL